MFEDAFDASAQGMAIIALDGRWLRVNAALCQIVGYDEAELLTMDFQALTHPDDLAHDLAVIKTMLAGESGSSQFEKRYVHRSWSRFVCDDVEIDTIIRIGEIDVSREKLVLKRK